MLAWGPLTRALCMYSRARLSRRTLLGALIAATPAFAAETDGVPDYFELPLEGMERISPTMWVAPLQQDVWITCFTFVAGNADIPTNGLIIASPDGVTLVDTGCDREQGALLLS